MEFYGNISTIWLILGSCEGNMLFAGVNVM